LLESTYRADEAGGDDDPVTDYGKALTHRGDGVPTASAYAGLVDALGRNWDGSHYRSDGIEGLLLGEQVAVRYLQDHLRSADLPFDGHRRRCGTQPRPGRHPAYPRPARDPRRRAEFGRRGRPGAVVRPAVRITPRESPRPG
jgi:hypothetical protein